MQKFRTHFLCSVNRFQPNAPFLYPRKMTFSRGIEIEHWTKMGLYPNNMPSIINYPFVFVVRNVDFKVNHSTFYRLCPFFSNLRSCCCPVGFFLITYLYWQTGTTYPVIFPGNLCISQICICKYELSVAYLKEILT